MPISFSWPLPYNYYPPMLGNGTLAMPVDPRGSMEQRDYCKAISRPAIVRTGYRYDNHAKEVVPFGFFETYAPEWGEPDRMEQELDFHAGKVTGKCVYKSGLETSYTAFIPQDADFLAIRIHNGTENAFFRYTLDARRLAVGSSEPGIIHWVLDGLAPDGVTEGNVYLVSEDKAAHFTADGRSFTLSSPDHETVFYLCFGEKARDAALSGSFAEHLHRNEAFWKNYFAQGYIRTPDEAVNRACDCALYYLKTITTPWSIPMALIPSHWQCRYFGFDEYFILKALLQAGHPELAKHVPEFRLQILPQAQRNYYNYGMPDSPAHYPWEPAEDGLEATSDGFWLRHVFDHANIALGAWEYWKFTGDAGALERYYPVMRSCMLYLEREHLTCDSVRGYEIGVVTDLERIGPSRRNPFMTACSIAYAFRCTAEAAEYLKVHAEDAARWRRIADDLVKNLPQNDVRYLPYPAAESTCAGMFSGIWPYPVLAEDDPKQLAAARDYMDREAEYGCMMKTMGRELCTWYAAWKTLFFQCIHDRKAASAFLMDTMRSAGYFGESFEANARLGYRPWFSTGAAYILQAVSSSFLLIEGDTLRIASAIPETWKDWEFLLAAPDDLRVHGKMENGKITVLELLPGPNSSTKTYRIVLPDGTEKILRSEKK